MSEIKGTKVSGCAHINCSVSQSDVMKAGFFVTSDIKKLHITFNTKNMESIIRFIFRTKYQYNKWQQFLIVAHILAIAFLIYCEIQLLTNYK